MDGKTGWILFENRYVVEIKKGKESERKSGFGVIGFGGSTKSQNVRKMGL